MGNRRNKRRRAGAIFGALVVSACAHQAVQAPVAVPDLFWPPAPAAPQARYMGALPDALATPPPRSFWARLWDFVIGAKAKRSETTGLELGRPFGVAARGDDVFVADPGAHQVLRVRWRRHSLSQITCEKRPWMAPMAIAVGPDDTLYVADAGAGVIVRIAPSGECSTLGAGALKRPTGVAFASGRIYVVDPPAHDVVAFSLQGKEVLRFGVRGDGQGQLNFPTGLAARSDGMILVVDSLNFRVSTFTSNGTYVSSFGESGDGSGAFGRPKAITFDERGRIFVTDTRHDVVVVFDSDGVFNFAIGGSGTEPGQLTLPAGVAVAGDMLFVANSFNRRIEAYQLLGGER